MDKRQGRQLLALYAVDVFLDAHADRLPNATATGARQRFAERLAELELHVATQSGAPLMAQGMTRAKQHKLKVLLRDHMAPIVRIARLEATAVPALAPVKMPRGDPGVHKLLAAAEGIAFIAQNHREVFIAAGLRPTFVEDLRAAIDDISATLAQRTGKRGAQVGATNGLERALASCNRYKAVLDSFIRTEAHDNVELLAYWTTITRVPRPPRRKKSDAESEAVASPAQSAASPAPPIQDPSRLLAPPVGDVGIARHASSSLRHTTEAAP